MEMFNYYIMKSIQLFGLTAARPVYEKAVESLPEKQAKEMALRFIDLEMKLGEVDRARALYGYTSQMCDPRLDPQFWDRWQTFEVHNGNEETFKEMLRIKRAVQSRFNTDVEYLSAQILANRQQQQQQQKVTGSAAEAGIASLVARPSETFIAGGKTMNGRPVDDGKAGEMEQAVEGMEQNPDEIQMEGDDDEFNDI
jgi:pre-mRNA-splicing factor SYF1